MKPFLTVFLLGLAGIGVTTAGEPEGSVRFSNNDLLSGSVESLSPDLLVWKSPVLEKPAPFFLNNIIELSLPGRLPESTANHEVTITLTNGDTVHGQLASLTDDAVSVDTGFAGRMTINRLMVRSLKIDERSALVYRGPDGLDGWKQTGTPPAWRYERGAFRCNATGGIARDVLPAECSVAFDAAWQGDSFAFKVILFSDDPTTDESPSGYELSFQRGNLYLQNRRNHGFLGNVYSRAMAECDKVRIEVRASRKSGKVCLFINDKIVEVWTDPDIGKNKFGGCLHFISMTTLPMRISGIRISPWDGLVEQMPEPQLGMARLGLGGQLPQENVKPAPQETPGKGRMKLANGDSMDGEVVSIQDGVIAVKTSLGEVSIPIARLRTVDLKKADLERSIRRNGDIRGWFSDGSSMVFRLDGVDHQTLTGSSQNFGVAKFRLDAFTRMEFNIYDPRMEELRGKSDW